MSLIRQEQDTICAISTPKGPGGIGVVRVSGHSAYSILKRLFCPKSCPDFLCIEPRRLYYGHIKDPITGEIIDECMAVFMKAPYTYTREDIVELQCHGSYASLRRVLDLAIREGARLSMPGEFTKRAFLNGRIDLHQAEAVIDIIEANTEYERRLAINAITGEDNYKELIEEIRSGLIEALSSIEVSIDFPEEDDALFDSAYLIGLIDDKVIAPVKSLLYAYEKGRLLREGAKVLLAGRPNVGKSSIFNAILGVSRVIVSPEPGTTRDMIEETIDLDGLRVSILDTAGIRQGATSIEEAGIRLCIEAMKGASLVLFVIDASQGIGEEDIGILQSIPPKKPVIAVLNKIDLLEGKISGKCDTANSKYGKVDKAYKTDETVKRLYSSLIKGSKDGVSIKDMVLTSVFKKDTIDALKKAISGLLLNRDIETPLGCETVYQPEYGLIPTLRQKEALDKVMSLTNSAKGLLSSGQPLELAAMDIKDAIRQLDIILGRELDSDLLNSIFSRFCLGK